MSRPLKTSPKLVSNDDSVPPLHTAQAPLCLHASASHSRCHLCPHASASHSRCHLCPHAMLTQQVSLVPSCHAHTAGVTCALMPCSHSRCHLCPNAFASQTAGATCALMPLPHTAGAICARMSHSHSFYKMGTVCRGAQSLLFDSCFISLTDPGRTIKNVVAFF